MESRDINVLYHECPAFADSPFWCCPEHEELLRKRDALLQRLNPRGDKRIAALLDLLVENCTEEAELSNRHYFTRGAMAFLQPKDRPDA